jgi:hypothetical protein
MMPQNERDEIKREEREEAEKYSRMIETSGWKAYRARLAACAGYYERIALNSGLKCSERVNALERVAALKEALEFPESFIQRLEEISEM